MSKTFKDLRKTKQQRKADNEVEGQPKKKIDPYKKSERKQEKQKIRQTY